MYDVKCPYCGKEQNINHDDGYGYEENEIYEQECINCEKIFAYTTQISFDYKTHMANCLNGDKHKFEPVIHYPKYWPDWKRCKDCGYEERGKF